jgi:hypothetical protein
MMTKNPVLTLLLYGFQSPLYDDKNPVLTLLLCGFQSPLYDDKNPVLTIGNHIIIELTLGFLSSYKGD